jgi:RNA polymerase sigma-70 factor (ECF subfamily)
VHASEPATRVGVEQILADIDRSLPVVYDYLLHRCGGRALAEDLTSETVLATVDHVRSGHIDAIEIG